MRICGVCRKLTQGEPVHAACQRPKAYTSLVHQRMSAIYRINNVPCAECGQTGTQVNPITAHHEEPVARGGRDVPDNYVPLCRVCNSKRGSRRGTE